MAPRVGFEPTTYRLTAECSTVELPRNIKRNADPYKKSKAMLCIWTDSAGKIALPGVCWLGDVLLSQAVTGQVPSALRDFTSVFGMGTGVSLLLCSPNGAFQPTLQ